MYDYNSANQRTKVTREDNAHWDYGYDALGQVNSAVKKLATNTPILGFSSSYTYDDIGNRKTATNNAQTSNYSANLLNQYSSHTVPGSVDVTGTAVTDAAVAVDGHSASRQGQNFLYSAAVDNTAGGVWKEFSVAGVRAGGGPGGTDAIAVAERKVWVPKTPEIFNYDVDGNLTSDGRWTYTWDGENRLIAMQTRSDILPPNGHFPLSEYRKLEFAYDLQGRRFSKKVSNWTGSAWTLASAALFVYDGWNLIAELNAMNANAAIRTYVWGLDLSGSMQGAGGVGGLLLSNAQTQNPGTHASAYDGNGNTIGLVDMATGTKSATYDYNAFGESIQSDGVASVTNHFRFSTKYQDDETGLYFYGYRFYQPTTGRWLSRDPIGVRGGVNIYGFVQNNGLNRFDAIGLSDGPIISPVIGDVGNIGDFQNAVDAGKSFIDGWNNQPWGEMGPPPNGLDDALAKLQDLSNNVKPGKCGCKVFLICRPIGLEKDQNNFASHTGWEGGAAGLLTGGRAKHCFLLLVSNCAGEAIPKTTIITLAAKPKGDYATVFNSSAETHEVGSGCDLCDKLKKQVPLYNSPAYNKNGPNSNTFQKEMLRANGLPDPFAGGASPWGWNYENPNQVWKTN